MQRLVAALMDGKGALEGGASPYRVEESERRTYATRHFFERCVDFLLAEHARKHFSHVKVERHEQVL